MSRTRTFGSYRLAGSQSDFHPYFAGSGKARRPRSASEQGPNVLQEIGSVAAVLHGAGLLTDQEVMRQFQEFAAAMLNSRAKDLKGLMPTGTPWLQRSATALS